MTDFTGGTGDDDFTGTADADTFDMTQGGFDTVRGLGGDDSFNFGAEFTAADRVFGGSGNDALVLAGDYSGGAAFTSNNFRNIEAIVLFGDFTFALGFQDDALKAGQVLEVDIAFGDGQLFLLSEETDGAFDILAGDGNDTVVTGAGNDIISTGDSFDNILPGAGRDTIDAGEGDDLITFRAGELTRKDHVDGGDTTDVNTVVLSGDYSDGVTLGMSTFSHINLIEVSFGNDYVIDLGKTTVAGSFGVDATDLEAANMVDFDGSRILGSGTFSFRGGAGDDRFVGGAGNDSLTGNLGADRLEGGEGLDFYNYVTVADSTGPGYDTVVRFDTDDDLFVFSPLIGVAVQAVGAKVTEGRLSDAGFNGDLEDAIGASELGASHAVVFLPDAGSLEGQAFVIVDCNNTAGYQRNEDLVIRLIHPQHLGNLDASDFFTV
jgi:hypothetical protein